MTEVEEILKELDKAYVVCDGFDKDGDKIIEKIFSGDVQVHWLDVVKKAITLALSKNEARIAELENAKTKCDFCETKYQTNLTIDRICDKCQVLLEAGVKSDERTNLVKAVEDFWKLKIAQYESSIEQYERLKKYTALGKPDKEFLEAILEAMIRGKWYAEHFRKEWERSLAKLSGAEKDEASAVGSSAVNTDVKSSLKDVVALTSPSETSECECGHSMENHVQVTEEGSMSCIGGFSCGCEKFCPKSKGGKR